MTALFTIGDFARATHLSVKTLRHYDDVGLLVPAEVDSVTGYRRYQAVQIPTAHVIRRLRDLEMPLSEIHEVLAAPDLSGRDAVLEAHLRRMESSLERTRETVAALRRFLMRATDMGSVEQRVVPATPVVLRRGTVAWKEVEDWLASAFAALHETAGEDACGPDGALFEQAFFEEHIGDVTAFVPALSAPTTLPAANYVVAVHRGVFDNLDETYGRLGAYVAANHLGVPGPLREHYVADLLTEVMWPVDAS
jgi:DNA-binding transcriptional MerR regulator